MSTLRETPPQHLFDDVLFGVEIRFEIVFAQSTHSFAKQSWLEFRFWKVAFGVGLGQLWARRGAGVEPSAEQIQDKRASGEVKQVLKNDGTHD